MNEPATILPPPADSDGGSDPPDGWAVASFLARVLERAISENEFFAAVVTRAIRKETE